MHHVIYLYMLQFSLQKMGLTTPIKDGGHPLCNAFGSFKIQKRNTVNSDGPFISTDKEICLSEHKGVVKAQYTQNQHNSLRSIHENLQSIYILQSLDRKRKIASTLQQKDSLMSIKQEFQSLQRSNISLRPDPRKTQILIYKNTHYDSRE